MCHWLGEGGVQLEYLGIKKALTRYYYFSQFAYNSVYIHVAFCLPPQYIRYIVIYTKKRPPIFKLNFQQVHFVC